MKINRNNYEVFFIDYFDGKLTDEQVGMLLLFLSENTDLAEEFSNFEEITLPISDITFDAKQSLKKITEQPILITESNFADINIAYFEGDLTSDEKKYFEKYLLKSPSKYKEFRLFAKTKLQPDLNIVFENKASLKRFTINKNYRKSFIAGLTAAAVILIMFFIYFSIPDKSVRNPQYAERTQPNNHKRIQNNEANKETHATEKNTNKINATNRKVKQPETKISKTFVAENKKVEKNIEQEKYNYKKNTDTVEQTLPIESIKLLALSNDIPEYENPNIDFSQYRVKNKIVKEQTVKQYLLAKVQKSLGKDKSDSQSKITILDVADAIVKGINKMTGKHLKLNRSYDSEGKLETLAFYSPGVQIYKGDKK